MRENTDAYELARCTSIHASRCRYGRMCRPARISSRTTDQLAL